MIMNLDFWRLLDRFCDVEREKKCEGGLKQIDGVWKIV